MDKESELIGCTSSNSEEVEDQPIESAALHNLLDDPPAVEEGHVHTGDALYQLTDPQGTWAPPSAKVTAVNLLCLRVAHKWGRECTGDMLQLLRESILPPSNTLASSEYTLLSALGIPRPETLERH